MRDRRVGQTLLHDERVTFADVAGVDHVIEELAEVREYLADRDRFERIGASVPTGYLLRARPAPARRCSPTRSRASPTPPSSPSPATEFVETSSVRARRACATCSRRRAAIAPAIVFIDEIDAIGGHRGGGPADNSERAQTLNQLLVELDALRRAAPVIVMAATNRPDMLDPALMRPGRFDRMLTLELPDLEARRRSSSCTPATRRMGPDVDLDAIARLTYGLSGADLNNLLNEAALLAARGGELVIGQAHHRGRARPRRHRDRQRPPAVRRGPPRSSPTTRQAMALSRARCPAAASCTRSASSPRGSAAGVTWMPEIRRPPPALALVLSSAWRRCSAAVSAEAIVFGELSDGAATTSRRSARSPAGWSPARHERRRRPAELRRRERDNDNVHYSDDTARLIDAEARRLVDEAEELARGVLTGRARELDRDRRGAARARDAVARRRRRDRRPRSRRRAHEPRRHPLPEAAAVAETCR